MSKMRTESLWRKERKTRRLVWAVKFLLMFLSVTAVDFLWPMRFSASFGWAGFLRAGLIGVLGAILGITFDNLQRVYLQKPYHRQP